MNDMTKINAWRADLDLRFELDPQLFFPSNVALFDIFVIIVIIIITIATHPPLSRSPIPIEICLVCCVFERTQYKKKSPVVESDWDHRNLQ